MHFICLFHIICIGSYSTLILPDVSNNEGVVFKNVQHDYHCSIDRVHCAEILRSVTFPLYNNRCTMFLLLSITKMRIDHLICVFSVWKDDFWWRGKIEEHTQGIASCTWISLKSHSLELPCKYWKDFPSPPPRWNRWVRDRHFAW